MPAKASAIWSETRVVGREQPVLGLPGGSVAVRQRGPQGRVAAERFQRVDERGIEPPPASPSGHRPRRARPARGVEDLHRLGETEDPSEQRDLLSSQPMRLASAVPVLVERADRLGGFDLESEHECDLRATVAPGLHQRPGHLTLRLDRQQPLEAGPERAARRDHPHRPQEGREPSRPVDALEVRLTT